MDEISLKQHLYELEQALLTDAVRSSSEQLTRYLAEDFFEIGSSGKVLYQNEDVTEMRLGKIQMTMTNFAVHPLRDDVVLVTYEVRNECNQQVSLRSSIWQRTAELWKMKFHQGTKKA
jgi:hypothetical protein